MRGRPPLPMETIIDAALQIVDEEGGEALSMRALARRLDSGTATIYRHFANRTEVVAHVVDRVFGEVQLDDPALARMPWQDACIVSSRALFDALRRHPNVAMLLADQIPVGPNVFMIREHTTHALSPSGVLPGRGDSHLHDTGPLRAGLCKSNRCGTSGKRGRYRDADPARRKYRSG